MTFSRPKTPMAAAVRAWAGLDTEFFGGLVLRALYLGLVFGPVVFLLAAASDDLASAITWPSERQVRLLARSCALSAGVAGLSMTLATLAALRIADGGRRLRLLGWFSLALAPVPAYIHAQAWSAMALEATRTAAAWGVRIPPFQGAAAATLVEVSAFLPLALGLALVALETVPQEPVDAARIARGDTVALKRVILPLAAPMLAAGSGLVFLLSLLDYSVPALYQVNVYPLAIFAEYSATHRVAGVVAFAVPLVAVATLVALLTQAGLRAATGRSPGQRRPARPLRLSRGIWLLRGAASATVVVLLLAPAVSLALKAGGVLALQSTLAGASAEGSFSVGVALAAAAIGAPLGAALGAQDWRPARRVFGGSP
jgi:iron(III) transport system permease protein